MEGGESRQEFLIGEHPLYTRIVKDQKTRALEVGDFADKGGDLSEIFPCLRCTDLLVLHGPGVKRMLTDEEFLPGLPPLHPRPCTDHSP